ncbi:MAG: glycolate oxidase subunit GlcE [Alphaproteobacteria bacterium]|nr:glycolate oxidase subunit GlcE [Alphaproteobacteria bacterium]
MSTFAPADEAEVRDAVAAAAAKGATLEVVGGGSKRGLGRPVAADDVLDVHRVAGVIDYAPEELMLTARAATPLVDIERLLARHGQALAFEPPDLGPLLGGEGIQTLGGIVAANLAGPRRMKAGAARDHVLAVRLVTGRGETVKAGGKVVKNVTGYDVCKLLAGSFGTLGVMTEITVKVLPAAEKTRTLLLFGVGVALALARLSELASGPLDISGAAWLPARVAARSGVGYVASAGAAVTAVRVEGPAASTLARAKLVKDRLATLGPAEELHGHNSTMLWHEIGGAGLLAGGGESPVWRLALPPSRAAAVAAALGEAVIVDGAGSVLWAAVDSPAGDPVGARRVRGLARDAEGVAVLMRAAPGPRASEGVFEPLAPGLAALTRRVKDAFDPRRVLNPGRMYAEL